MRRSTWRAGSSPRGSTSRSAARRFRRGARCWSCGSIPTNPANAAKLAAFVTAYPNIPQGTILVGGYAGTLNGGVLDNGGETVRLSAPRRAAADEPAFIPYLLVDEVDYDDVAPWPTGPDGTGPSLTRPARWSIGNEAANWAGSAASPGVASVTPGLTTITGTSGNDVYHVVRSGRQLWIYENTPPVGAPTYSSELSAIGPSLTINTLGGDDTLIVNSGGEPTLGIDAIDLQRRRRRQQPGAAKRQRADRQHGDRRHAGQHDPDRRQLSTDQLNQNGLTLADAARVTLLPGGATSKLTSLNLGAGPRWTSRTMRWWWITRAHRRWGHPRQHSVGPGRVWFGQTLERRRASPAARRRRSTRRRPTRDRWAMPRMRSCPWVLTAAFRGQAVDLTSVLIAYTRTADANLDGVVNNDDVTVVGANFAPGAAEAGLGAGRL